MSRIMCTRCVGRAAVAHRTFSITATRSYSDAAHLLNTPLTPGPVKPPSQAPILRSTTFPGTKLANINYFKNKADPVALEDSEYPEWLWSTLDSNNAAASEAAEDVGDLYSKSKKVRQAAKKREARLAALAALDTEVRVPIEEQTVDLPFATISDPLHGPAITTPLTKTVALVGSVATKVVTAKNVKKPTTIEIGSEGAVQVTAKEAADARLEIKKALRKKGRAKIKEDNFLAQM